VIGTDPGAGEQGPPRARLIGDPADVPADREPGPDGPLSLMLGRSRGRRIVVILLVAVLGVVLATRLGSSGRDRTVGPAGAFPAVTTAGAPLTPLGEVRGRGVVVGGLVVRAAANRVDALRVSGRSTYWSLVRDRGPHVEDLTRVDDRHVAVLWGDGRLDLVDLAAGEIAWSVQVPGVQASGKDATPGTSGGLLVTGSPEHRALVAASAGGLTAYDAAGGADLWKRGDVSPVDAGPAGVLVTTFPQGDAELLDPRTGKPRLRLPSAGTDLLAGAVSADGAVVVTGGDHPQVLGLLPGARPVAWRAPVGSGRSVSLAVADGLVVVGSADDVTVRDLADGQPADQTGLSAPAVVATAQGLVYAAGQGRLSAVRPGEGPARSVALRTPQGARPVLSVADGVLTVTSGGVTRLYRAPAAA
jgi:hypothetical protein